MSLITANKKTYNSSVAILTSLTFFTGLASIFLGFIFVPFATAFFAMLLMCEAYGKRRICSYIIPAVVLAVDIIINRYYIFSSASFIIVGFLLFFMYAHRVGKIESVFILSGALFAFYIASSIFVVFSLIGKTSTENFSDALVRAYDMGKEWFLGQSNDYNNLLAELGQQPIFTSEFVITAYNRLIFLLPPLFFVASIVSIGIATKMFKFFSVKFTVDAPNAMKWRLHTPTIMAIVYIVASILNIFVGTGVFGICVSWIYLILSIIYAYIGIKFVYQFISLKKSSLLAVAVIVLAFVFLSSFAYQLASYFGAYYVISVNRRTNQNRPD